MKKIILPFLFLSVLFQSVYTQELISTEFLQSRSKSSLQAEFGSFIKYGVDMYKITYTTPDIYGVTDTASGLFCIPDETYKRYPFLIYQHGTVDSKDDVPSNLEGGYQLAMFWGGMGYLSCAPDYLGLGDSRGFHPYVHSATEASAAIDMILAAKDFPFENIEYNDQLFVTGYSQGGHAAAAAQKAIEENPATSLTVTASAPMSGPYSVSGVMKGILVGDDPYYFPAYGVWTALSYNDVYELSLPPAETFKEPIATWATQFYNHEIGLFDLNEDIIAWLETNYGASVPKHMFQDSILNDLLDDIDSPYDLALQDNDLFDWAPQAPTRLFYCNADDQVPFNNSIIADNAMNAAGALNTDAVPADSLADHGGCVEPAVTLGFLFFAGLQNIEDIDPPVSTVNLDNTLEFQVSPNPATDVLTIRFKNQLSQPVDLNILTLGGQALQSAAFSEDKDIDISRLAPGVYLIQAVAEEGIWVEKVVIF